MEIIIDLIKIVRQIQSIVTIKLVYSDTIIQSDVLLFSNTSSFPAWLMYLSTPERTLLSKNSLNSRGKYIKEAFKEIELRAFANTIYIYSSNKTRRLCYFYIYQFSCLLLLFTLIYKSLLNRRRIDYSREKRIMQKNWRVPCRPILCRKILCMPLLIFIRREACFLQTVWHPQRSEQIFLIHIGWHFGVNSGHTSNRECIN